MDFTCISNDSKCTSFNSRMWLVSENGSCKQCPGDKEPLNELPHHLHPMCNCVHRRVFMGFGDRPSELYIISRVLTTLLEKTLDGDELGDIAHLNPQNLKAKKVGGW